MSEPLYVTEAQCAARLGFSRTAWAELSARYERQGMARRDPISGRRYWPAVKAFMDMHNGVAAGNPADAVSPGEENPNALASLGRRARTSSHSAR